MPSDNAPRTPFDEQAALQELERLRDAIVETRRRRSERSDEFDAFVRSFRAPATQPGERPAERAQAPRGDFSYPGRQNRDPVPERPPQTVTFEPPLIPERRAAPEPRVEPEPAVPKPPPAPRPEAVRDTPPAPAIPPADPTPAPAAPPPPAVAPDMVPPFPAASSSDTAPPRTVAPRRSIAPWAAIGAAIVIGTIALVARGWSTRTVEPSEARASSPSAADQASAAAPQAAPPSASAATPEASSGSHAMQGELVADRRVWVRVIADGEKLVEREVAAGTRLPVNADRSIVIRAGDAGALHLRINGVDRGALGRDAEVVTRTFTPQ